MLCLTPKYQFNNVADLIAFYQYTNLSEHFRALDTTLSMPCGRFRLSMNAFTSAVL